MSDVKRVYTFGDRKAEGKADMKNLLGGKGANLAEMNLIGVPVPPGFTITTEVCTEYNDQAFSKRPFSGVNTDQRRDSACTEKAGCDQNPIDASS